MATIHDVARAAGVSTATVSRSFALKHPLKEKTRERVLREAERLDYRPRRSVRSGGEAGGVSARGIVSVGFQYFLSNTNDRLPTNAFYGPVLAGAQLEAEHIGIHLMLNTGYRYMPNRTLPQMVSEQAIRGMLIAGTTDPDILSRFLHYVPTIILIDARDPLGRHDCVVSDGFSGAACAVKHLACLGHRKIAFVGDLAVGNGFADRLNGYIGALHRAGLPIERRLMCGIVEPDISTNMDESVEQVVEFLKGLGDDRPTAIVAANDVHGLASMHACRRLGLELPRDMSIIGFDDTDFSAHAYPALTTVRVEKEQMGRVAVRRLMARLHELDAGEPGDPPLVLELPVTLIERNSCAAPLMG